MFSSNPCCFDDNARPRGHVTLKWVEKSSKLPQIRFPIRKGCARLLQSHAHRKPPAPSASLRAILGHRSRSILCRYGMWSHALLQAWRSVRCRAAPRGLQCGRIQSQTGLLHVILLALRTACSGSSARIPNRGDDAPAAQRRAYEFLGRMLHCPTHPLFALFQYTAGRLTSHLINVTFPRIPQKVGTNMRSRCLWWPRWSSILTKREASLQGSRK